MDIVSLLNPTKAKDRVGKERVEKSCPSCAVKNHIRTTYCRKCNYKLRGPPNPAVGRIVRGPGGGARGARQRSHGVTQKAASGSLAQAASAAGQWERKKDKRRATQKLPTTTGRARGFAAGLTARFSGKKTHDEPVRGFYADVDPRAVDVDIYQYPGYGK